MEQEIVSTQLSFSALGEIPDNKMHLGSSLSDLLSHLISLLLNTVFLYCLPCKNC